MVMEIVVPGEWTCLGYVKIAASDLVTARKLGTTDDPVPDGTSMVQVQVEGGNVRYRGDAESPTSTDGMLLVDGAEMVYPGAVLGLRFIAVASSPTLHVQYFKTH